MKKIKQKKLLEDKEESKLKVSFKSLLKIINSTKNNFIFYLVITLFLEAMFALLMFSDYQREGIINTILYSIMLSSILSIISFSFKDKCNRIITGIILFIIGFIFSLQTVFYNIFTTYFSFTLLGLGNQLKSFLEEAIKLVTSNFFYLLVYFSPFILFLIFKKKLKVNRNKPENYIIYFFIFVITSLIFHAHILSTKGEEYGSYYLYHDVNEVNLNIKKLGVINSTNLDVYRTLFGFEEKIVKENKEEVYDQKEEIVKYTANITDIDFSKPTSNKEIKTINDYLSNSQPTYQNEYTGLFKDYNLIYITAESFNQIAVSEKYTPTLYKLVNSGFIFDNFYTPNNLSTIGGEFMSITGIYPESSILTTWRSGKNYYPNGLATVFKDMGYKTHAYHNNWYGFQDRHKYLKSQGFTNYLGCYNGLEKRMNCSLWPQSDDEMIKVTTKDYINEDKFLAYYMTVSGHFEYNFSGNSMAYRNRNRVKDLDGPTGAKAYMAANIELDKALERLLKELEEKGVLDKTVIVLMADHYPYELDLNSINALSTYKRDKTIEVNHSSLILWNSKLKDKHIEKPCMSVDVIPTIYNLFGVKYDSRLFTGRDIFSTNAGLVIFKNHSWITEKGTYNASKQTFNAKEEVTDNYVKDMNSIVNNRLKISKLIIKNNYFRYLFK